MAEIELRDVTKRFADGTEAVRQMSLRVADGEFMILVGPSGCGKSTALRMIAGLEEISDGDLLIGGERVNELPPRERDIAMVFQNYALYPHMTVRQNMGFALKLAKFDRAEIDERVEEAARILDLVEQLDRKPANLSGGQRQRVAMGRAIVRDPAAFLMDEPLSNLDAKLRVQMRAEVSRLQKRLDTTTVYVTHDQTEAMTLGDRVAVMRLGVIQQAGTPEELYERPINLFVAGFIGSPSMNFVPADIHGDTVRLPFLDVPVPGDLRGRLNDGRHVIVGIRPEHIEAAELVPPGRHEGVAFTMRFDLIESMGSEIYAHFDLGAGGIESDQLRELAEDAGVGELPARDETDRGVARLSPDANVGVGRDVELFLHTARLHFFDPEDGHSLRAQEQAPAAVAV